MLKSLFDRKKFRPHIKNALDLAASISFRGMDVVQKKRLYGVEDTKYRRGIFQKRFKLSRIPRQLESYGELLLPFEPTKNM